MTQKSYYQQAHFLQSAAKLEQLPPDKGIEVAFAGRSNAGKSTALNAITTQRGLARASKTPGRTQLINLFALDEQRRLVDLPGYGYAKVPEETRLRWQHTLARYLQERKCLQGLMLMMDIRHPLKEQDQNMIEWANQIQLPVHILLTKADKLSRSEMLKTVQTVKNVLQKQKTKISIQAFSATHHLGLDDARLQLDQWFKV